MFEEKSYSLKMDKAIEVFSKELSSLRTGRANVNMLDTIKVDVKVVEGTRERIQAFEGVCIAKKNRDNKNPKMKEIGNFIFLPVI